MEYQYKAITKTGERLEGYTQAFNEREARKELLERFASVLTLTPVAGGTLPSRQQLKVKTENIVIFFRRLGTMMNSGVQLAAALEFLAESSVEPSLAETVEILNKGVHEGRPLSHAMRHPKLRRVFDDESIGMISMAEQTGALGKVIDKVADLKERQLQLTKAFVSALTYPAVLFCVILILVVIFSLILGPGDEGLFAAFGTEMPWPTRVVQGVSDTLRKPWLVGLFVLTGAAIFAAFRRRMDKDHAFRLWVHTFYLKLPVVGGLIKKVEAARILYFLTDALNVGIPLASALVMATSVCGNERTRVELRLIHKEFCDGDGLAEALSRRAIFPTMALSMMETGLESGRLDMVMDKVSEVFEEDVRLALNSLSQLAEPVLLIFAGFIAGFFAIATLMPLIQMVETL